MYYENKKMFYIKQYGPAVAVIIISIALIVTGLVIGFTPDNKVASVTPVEKDAYTYTKQAIKGTVKEVNISYITKQFREEIRLSWIVCFSECKT